MCKYTGTKQVVDMLKTKISIKCPLFPFEKNMAATSAIFFHCLKSTLL